MLFSLFMLDKPNQLGTRQEHLDPHRAYLGEAAERFFCGGPLKDETGEACGSLLIMEFKDFAETEAWRRQEPFNRAGVYGTVITSVYEDLWPKDGRKPKPQDGLFVFHNPNGPDGLAIKEKVGAEHRAYLAKTEKDLFFAGPLLETTGKQRNGSLYCVQFDSRDAAQEWFENEPYQKAGAFVGGGQWAGVLDNKWPKS